MLALHFQAQGSNRFIEFVPRGKLGAGPRRNGWGGLPPLRPGGKVQLELSACKKIVHHSLLDKIGRIGKRKYDPQRGRTNILQVELGR